MMANPNNDDGSPSRGPFSEGGSSSQGASGVPGGQPAGIVGGLSAAGASAQGERPGARAADSVARATDGEQPIQRYSFRALVAMGLIGFAVGRLCSR